jgi:hypothetical protein
MLFEFSGPIFFWRGPSPYYFVAMPEQESRDLKAVSKLVTYGWGVIPVRARLGQTEWKTSLFPKDGRYLVPIRTDVWRAEQLEEGQLVAIRLEIEERHPRRSPGRPQHPDERP